jgi:Iap family predicted aminopeptidase
MRSPFIPRPIWNNYFCLIALLLAPALVLAQSKLRISTEEELKDHLTAAPCANKERIDGVHKLFRGMGASEKDIKVEKLGDVENLVVTKPGKGEGTVIVGAHFDKTVDGCGVIDNWSGIVVLAHLYRTIMGLDTQKTFVFAGFGREEEGLIGSDAMADRIPKEERSRICAMVNLDSFGLAYPQALRNVSDESLIKLAESVSKDMKIPFASAGIDVASSDSASFRSKKIPAISLHGLDNRWRSVLHTRSDTMANMNTQSVYIGYRHALVMLSRIENSPCDSFRK